MKTGSTRFPSAFFSSKNYHNFITSLRTVLPDFRTRIRAIYFPLRIASITHRRDRKGTPITIHRAYASDVSRLHATRVDNECTETRGLIARQRAIGNEFEIDATNLQRKSIYRYGRKLAINKVMNRTCTWRYDSRRRFAESGNDAPMMFVRGTTVNCAISIAPKITRPRTVPFSTIVSREFDRVSLPSISVTYNLSP